MVKLRSAVRVDIKPNATVEIKVLEHITIPEGLVIGKFFIRKSLSLKSLNSPDCKFRAGWNGVPSLVIQNGGANTVEILAGDELGELDLIPVLDSSLIIQK